MLTPAAMTHCRKSSHWSSKHFLNTKLCSWEKIKVLEIVIFVELFLCWGHMWPYLLILMTSSVQISYFKTKQFSEMCQFCISVAIGTAECEDFISRREVIHNSQTKHKHRVSRGRESSPHNPKTSIAPQHSQETGQYLLHFTEATCLAIITTCWLLSRVTPWAR